MINRNSNDLCDDIRADIPWYVNGTLSSSATETLRDHVEHCEVCQADLEAHRLMRDSILDRELTPMVPSTKAEEIIGIDQSDRGGHTLGEWVTPWSAAIAASLAILAVAFVLFNDSSNGADVQNQSYETATSAGSTDGIDYVLQIHFDHRVSAEQRAEIAIGLDGALRWTVDDRGVYEVHLRLAAPSLEALQALEAHVGSISGVDSAEFTALQLPMK